MPSTGGLKGWDEARILPLEAPETMRSSAPEGSEGVRRAPACVTCPDMFGD